jgi:hypothetical protein
LREMEWPRNSDSSCRSLKLMRSGTCVLAQIANSVQSKRAGCPTQGDTWKCQWWHPTCRRSSSRGRGVSLCVYLLVNTSPFRNLTLLFVLFSPLPYCQHDSSSCPLSSRGSEPWQRPRNANADNSISSSVQFVLRWRFVRICL